MKIMGLQKLTLLDYPGNMASTIFTGGCNFRCPFCHNSSLVISKEYKEEISKEELLDFLNKRKKVLDGVCITGGEPLLHEDTIALIKEIKNLGLKVKLDTNGSFPERLKRLVNEHLVDYVAMDIKNQPRKYGTTIGIEAYDLQHVKESVKFLLEDHVPYEFRTTVVSEYHEATDFEEIGKWIKGAKKYFLQGFVDSGNLIQEGLHGCSKEEMEKYRQVVLKYIPTTEIRGM